jgi:hypothetical protein
MSGSAWEDPNAGKAATEKILSVPEFTKKLTSAASASDLESVLNNFGVPTSGLQKDDVTTLKKVLQSIVDAPMNNITNKVVRRRMTRMIFAISSAEEKQVIKSIVKVVKPQPPPKNKSLRIAASAPPKAPPKKSAQVCADEVASITADTFESVLAGLVPENIQFSNRSVLVDGLKVLLENNEIVTNAKNRRRVSRLIQTLESSTGADEPTEEVVSTPSVKRKSVTACIDELKQANADNVDSILQGITAENIETSGRGELVSALEILQDNKELVTNAKIRRRVTRLIQTFSAPSTESKSAAVSVAIAPAKSVTMGADSSSDAVVESLSLKDCIGAVRRAPNADELDKVLTRIPWSTEAPEGSSTQTLFLDLKKILNDVSMKESIVSNAKVRRRVKRIIEMIDSKLNSSAPKVAVDNKKRKAGEIDGHNDDVATKKISKPVSDAAEAAPDGASDGGDEKQIPRVVFIGQLAFDATAEDVEKFLRENGINHEMTVRMLTDAKTKKY